MTKTSLLKPVECAVLLFGSANKLAKVIGQNRTCVSRWRRPKEFGGTDGYLPMPVAQRIYEIALERGLEITAEELMVGRRLERTG